MFFNFCSGTLGLFEYFAQHGSGSLECVSCGTPKESVGQVLFECTAYMIPRDNLYEYLRCIVSGWLQLFALC